MPSTFLGLNTGLSGLTYFQTALNTTAHNISNADTKGYSRQNVQASASDALRLNKTYGMMGTGITASAVERQRNAYYDTKYWSANSKYSQYNSQHANLEQLQNAQRNRPRGQCRHACQEQHRRNRHTIRLERRLRHQCLCGLRRWHGHPLRTSV